MLADRSLSERYGEKAQEYLRTSRDIFDKWDKRGAWRASGDGGISIVVPYGIDEQTGGWTEGVKFKNDLGYGFSHRTTRRISSDVGCLHWARLRGKASIENVRRNGSG